jgi:four helix bundle protein
VNNKTVKPKRFDLMERLIHFSVRIIQFCQALPNSKVGNHIRGELLQCRTSPPPNYAEAQSAESRSDFIHRMKIALKKLRETKSLAPHDCPSEFKKTKSRLHSLIQECDELISIFVKSVNTADSNRKKPLILKTDANSKL